jgi:hypothetical protein
MFKNLADPAQTLDSLFFYTACYERETGRAVLRSCSEGGPLFSSVSHVLAARGKGNFISFHLLFVLYSSCIITGFLWSKELLLLLVLINETISILFLEAAFMF